MCGVVQSDGSENPNLVVVSGSESPRPHYNMLAEVANQHYKMVTTVVHNPTVSISVFVGFSRIFLLGILIFKGLIARCLYKSFGVKGLIS
jgi:hypothetical protein